MKNCEEKRICVIRVVIDCVIECKVRGSMGGGHHHDRMLSIYFSKEIATLT